jgi:gluconokinase
MMGNIDSKTHVVVVMGVSGCGKTSVAQALGKSRSWRSLDADDFHPASNVEKMRTGTPLNDEDRWPWLDKLNSILRHSAAKHESIVLACSALKEVYRERLTQRIAHAKVTIVYLEGSYELIEARMKARNHQYMPSTLLKSQFDTLEKPENAIVLSIEMPIDEQVKGILKSLET